MEGLYALINWVGGEFRLFCGIYYLCNIFLSGIVSSVVGFRLTLNLNWKVGDTVLVPSQTQWVGN